MPGSTWLKVVMNVILIVCILIIVFIGEKTECQGAEEGVFLCLARVVLCSTVQRAGDDLAGIALPGAPLHVEACEAVPVQVAQLAVRHQPAIGPAWHRWTRLVRTSAAQNHLCHTSLESYGIFC